MGEPMGACGVPKPDGRRWLVTAEAWLGACLVAGAVVVLSFAWVLVPLAEASPDDGQPSTDDEQPAAPARLQPPPPLSVTVGSEAGATVEVEAEDESTCLHAGEAAGLDITFGPRCGEDSYRATVTVRADDGAQPGPRTVELEARSGDTVVAGAGWPITVVGALPGPPPPTTAPTTPPTAGPTPPPTDGPDPTSPPTTSPPVSPPNDGNGPDPDPEPGEPSEDPLDLPGRLLVNPVERMRLGEHATVTVRVSRDLSADLTENLLEGGGPPQQEDIRLSALMSAKLNGGEAFHVTPISKEEQFVHEDGFTEWAWRIEPRRSGSHSLFLTVSAYLSHDTGISRDFPVRSWPVTVERNLTYSTRTFLGSNWQYLLTTMVGSGLLGMFVGRRGKGR